MAERGRDIHPAIQAVAAEENEWRAIGFKEPNEALLDVGCTPELGGYYFRRLAGTSDPAYLDELEAIEPTPVDRGHALDLRARFDANWRERPITEAWLGKLLETDFFRDPDEERLLGYQSTPTDKHPDMAYTVAVEPTGMVEVEVDDPAYVDGGKSVDWHKYRLLPGRFYAEHEVQPVDDERFVGRVVGSHTIVSEVNKALERLAKLSEESSQDLF